MQPALRHEATNRGDAAILPVLRRIAPFAEKRAWVLSPNDSNLSVFTDYEITDDKDAAAAIEQLQRNLSTSILELCRQPEGLDEARKTKELTLERTCVEVERNRMRPRRSAPGALGKVLLMQTESLH